jgi:hypothetical protein
MKQNKTHKDISPNKFIRKTLCGILVRNPSHVTRFWEFVTCKRCMNLRGKQ